ncbi:MAG TPA: energy transducer TonB [Bryobacteraceae bacterium]|nr:energy transducer TonB [Bryobacteraceae bacterium]
MLVSIALHVLAVMLLILLAPAPLNVIRVPRKERPKVRILLRPVPSPSKGGGGSSTPLPPSRGVLPRFAQRQFTPPVVVPVNFTPKLAVEPTLVMAATVELRPPEGPMGLPSGTPGPPSGGPGVRGGLGGGNNGGAGNDSGPGVDGIRAVPLRGDMKAPVVLYKLEPEYSEEARKARIQGTVVLEGIIDEKGLTHAVKVRDGLGFGLDEQALDAVKRWRFRPATKDGKPLAIIGTFYLIFRLL